MRNHAGVKAILCLPFVLASCAWADEASDRVAIDAAIAALNQLPLRAAVFTADAYSELDKLPNVQPRAFRSAPLLPPDGRLVTISHEPWGEATLNFPGVASGSSAAVLEILNPRISSGTIRFVTPDVAVTDGVWTFEDDNGTTQTIPLLFVMKREGESWKIASLRVLSPR